MKAPRSISPAPVLFVLLTAGPLLLGVGYAGLYSLGVIGRLGGGFTTEAWVAVLGGSEFYLSLGFSLAVAAVSVGLATAAALSLVTWGGHHLQRGSWTLASYLPLAFPAAVVAFIGFQGLSGAGLLSRLAYRLGLIQSTVDFPTLINDRLGVGIVLAHVAMAAPFLTVYFGALYRSERLGELRALATTLGTAPTQLWRRTVWPVLLWRGRATLLLYGLFVMGSYEIPLLLGSQQPQMVSVYVVRKLSRFSLDEMPEAYVIAVCYAALVGAGLGVRSVWRRYAGGAADSPDSRAAA